VRSEVTVSQTAGSIRTYTRKQAPDCSRPRSRYSLSRSITDRTRPTRLPSRGAETHCTRQWRSGRLRTVHRPRTTGFRSSNRSFGPYVSGGLAVCEPVYERISNGVVLCLKIDCAVNRIQSLLVGPEPGVCRNALVAPGGNLGSCQDRIRRSVTQSSSSSTTASGKATDPGTDQDPRHHRRREAVRQSSLRDEGDWRDVRDRPQPGAENVRQV